MYFGLVVILQNEIRRFEIGIGIWRNWTDPDKSNSLSSLHNQLG